MLNSSRGWEEWGGRMGVQAGLKFCARGRGRAIREGKVAKGGEGRKSRNEGGRMRCEKERRTYVVNCGGHEGGWETFGVLIIALYNKHWRWTLHSHSFPTFGVPGGMSISGILAQRDGHVFKSTYRVLFHLFKFVVLFKPSEDDYLHTTPLGRCGGPTLLPRRACRSFFPATVGHLS